MKNKKSTIFDLVDALMDVIEEDKSMLAFALENIPKGTPAYKKVGKYLNVIKEVGK